MRRIEVLTRCPILTRLYGGSEAMNVAFCRLFGSAGSGNVRDYTAADLRLAASCRLIALVVGEMVAGGNLRVIAVSDLRQQVSTAMPNELMLNTSLATLLVSVPQQLTDELNRLELAAAS